MGKVLCSGSRGRLSHFHNFISLTSTQASLINHHRQLYNQGNSYGPPCHSSTSNKILLDVKISTLGSVPGWTVSPTLQARLAMHRWPKMFRKQPHIRALWVASSSHQSMLNHETPSHPMFVASIIETKRAHHHWIRSIVQSPTDHWDQHGLLPQQPVFRVNLEMHRLLQAPPVVYQGQTSSQTCVVRQLELQAKHRHPQLLQ